MKIKYEDFEDFDDAHRMLTRLPPGERSISDEVVNFKASTYSNPNPTQKVSRQKEND